MAQLRTETDVVPGHTSAAGRAIGSWSVMGFALRPLLAAGVLMAIDWATVLGCLALTWAVRDGPLLRMAPSLGPLPPFATFFVDLYFLVPWTLAFMEARLYSLRALFWSETRQVLRACTVAALFAVFLSFAVRTAEELSRLVLVGVWLTTLLVAPVVR